MEVRYLQCLVPDIRRLLLKYCPTGMVYILSLLDEFRGCVSEVDIRIGKDDLCCYAVEFGNIPFFEWCKAHVGYLCHRCIPMAIYCRKKEMRDYLYGIKHPMHYTCSIVAAEIDSVEDIEWIEDRNWLWNEFPNKDAGIDYQKRHPVVCCQYRRENLTIIALENGSLNVLEFLRKKRTLSQTYTYLCMLSALSANKNKEETIQWALSQYERLQHGCPSLFVEAAITYRVDVLDWLKQTNRLSQSAVDYGHNFNVLNKVLDRDIVPSEDAYYKTFMWLTENNFRYTTDGIFSALMKGYLRVLDEIIKNKDVEWPQREAMNRIVAKCNNRDRVIEWLRINRPNTFDE
jgi:hypothetical protein